MTKLRRNWHRLFLLGVIVFTILVISIKRVVARKVYQITHPPRVVSPMILDANSQPVDSINLSTSDGLQLAGWYIPPQNGAAIILQHGYHTNREEMLPIALMLARHGYGVLLFDFRGHGKSEGEMVTFGLNEVKDTEAALTFLRKQPEVNLAKIGLIGNSMGGAVGILAAAELEGIRVIVVEGVFPKLEDEIAVGIRVQTLLPATPFALIFKFFAERVSGYRISDIVPVEKISKISPRPLLILQGGADERIPIDSGERLFAVAGEPKEYWYEPMIAHAAFSTSIPTKYEQRVISFLDKYLMQ